MEKIVSKYLNYLKIHYSRKHFEKLILSHPEYPSLLSVADSFERLGVNYKIARIEKEQLNDLTFPYLLYIERDHGEILFIKNENDLKIKRSDLEFWNGIVLLVDDSSIVKDHENKRLRNEETVVSSLLFIVFFAAITILILPFVFFFSWISTLFITTSLIGVFLGYLLVAKDLGVKYDLIEVLCDSGKNINCDKILSSKGASLLGIIKFSDAVAIYFIFQSVLLSIFVAFPSNGFSISFILFGLSMLTIPIIVFSLYYQFAARTWCTLCLLVDTLLTFQIIIFLNFQHEVQFDFKATLLSILLLLILGSSILLLKNCFEKINKLEKTDINASRIIYSPKVFRDLLIQQSKIDTTPFDNELLLGNKGAPIKLVIASNLYCNPCSESHQILEQLIDLYPNKICIAVRFVHSARKNNIGQYSANQYVLQHWLDNIYLKEDETIHTTHLLGEWFKLMDLEKFAKAFPIKGVSDFRRSNQLIDQHNEWIRGFNISLTPTLLINGYKLPIKYKIQDILSLVPALLDIFNEIENNYDRDV